MKNKEKESYMKKFIEKIRNICEKNKNVAMFIDMDGTINEYVVYSEATVSKKMEDGYGKIAPVLPVINVLEEISNISNIDIYILSLSKTKKISEEKNIWLEKHVGFIPKENWIVLTKENGDYNKENRDIIKPLKMEEKLDKYEHVILLDDDHKILKQSAEMLKDKADVFHVTSVLI